MKSILRAMRPLILVGVGLATILGLASPTTQAVAQGQTFPTIDTVIDNYLPRFSNFQANYALSNGRYFQALWSHADVPDEASNDPPDQLTSRPTDQLEDFAAMWDTVRIGQGRLPLRFRIDVYNGPCGQGYVIVIQTSRAGNAYTRSVNVGCEAHRDQPWQPVVTATP